MQDSILVVEDELDIAELIKVHMQDINLNVEICDNGLTATKKALSQSYSLLILDINLPGCSGLDICRKVREKKPEQAILMLTSRTSEIDRIVGLEIGADDYMTKPFSVRELQARVHAMLRRVHLLENNNSPDNRNNTHGSLDINSNTNILQVGKLTINQQTHQATVRGNILDLTTTEFDLLYYLAKNPHHVFSRTQLLDQVWGYQHSGYEHTVNSHINRLRKKLKTSGNNSTIIETVFGVGYKFNPDSVLE